MSSSRSLKELASVIQARVDTLDEALKATNAPQPTLDINGPPALMVPPQFEDTKEDLLEALDELRTLIIGPVANVFSRSNTVSS
jgi:hypothetical protein